MHHGFLKILIKQLQLHFDSLVFSVGAGNSLRDKVEAKVDNQVDADVAEDEVSIIKFMQSVSTTNSISNNTNNPNPVVNQIL